MSPVTTAIVEALRTSSVYSPITWPDSRSPVLASGRYWNERPASGMTSIRDPAGNDLTLSPTGYVVDVYNRPGRIVLFERPDLAPVPAAVRISFSAGYDTDAVPPTLLQAVKLLVGHYYENREGAIDRTISTVPLAVESLLLKHAMPEAV